MKYIHLSIIVAVLFVTTPAIFGQISIDLYVDLGHGGTDPGNLGAYIQNFSEDTVNLLVGLILKEYLDLPPINYTYHFSRLTNDVSMTPDERADDLPPFVVPLSKLVLS